MNEQLPLKDMLEQTLADDDLLVWARRGSSDRLVVCFSGIGYLEDAPPGPEFIRSAAQDGLNNVLYVADPHRTWLNAPGLMDKIADLVRDFAQSIGAGAIFTMGHSMGGFAAIVMAKALGAVSAVAFAPQYSVHPEIVGDDKRWMQFRDKITEYRCASVAPYLDDQVGYVVYHGRHVRERFQRDRFPFRKNLYHFIVPRTTHNVPQKFKKRDLLDEVVTLSFQQRVRAIRIALKPLEVYRRTVKDNPLMEPSGVVA